MSEEAYSADAKFAFTLATGIDVPVDRELWPDGMSYVLGVIEADWQISKGTLTIAELAERWLLTRRVPVVEAQKRPSLSAAQDDALLHSAVLARRLIPAIQEGRQHEVVAYLVHENMERGPFASAYLFLITAQTCAGLSVECLDAFIFELARCAASPSSIPSEEPPCLP